MSYSVYATSSSLFMQRFYERLIGHVSLSEAVAAGRQELHTTPQRRSVIGPLELRDWMVPTLYQQEVSYIPIPPAIKAGAEGEPAQEAPVQHEALEKLCPEGRFGFVGRDYDLLRIERMLRDPAAPWVLLTGIGGTGKTQLAYGFARWYTETGGCPGGVFATSFKEKAGIGQVIGSIAGYGTDFSVLPVEQQVETLVRYLRDTPSLLVWDNVETVTGYPQGCKPLATEEEQAALARFLQALRGGKSRVLITTRKPNEDWLGIAYQLLEVTGLAEQDAGELAERILKNVGRQPQDFKDDPEYSGLLKPLLGHQLGTASCRERV